MDKQLLFMKRKFYYMILVLFILRALDLFLTYLYIPNLSKEYNPIVSIFGASWFDFISIQLLLLMIIAFFTYFYFHYPSVKVTEKNLNFTDFIYCFFYGKPKPWPQRMFSSPKNFTPHMIFNGFMFASSSIFVSLFAIINNYLLIQNSVWYTQFLIKNYRLFFPVIFLLSIICSFLLFFKRQYSKYLLQYDN